MSYQNKYFHARNVDKLDKNIGSFSDILFLNDIGPYKRGEIYPSGYITIDITKNTLCIETNSVTDPQGSCDKSYTIDLL